MTTLTDFLLARIAEDEELWRMAHDGQLAFMVRGHESPAVPPAGFAAQHLAECEAKRRIVERFAWTIPEVVLEQIAYDAYTSLCDLALPYADHPDYRDEWRP